MLRLIRTLILLVVLLAIVFIAYGYWTGWRPGGPALWPGHPDVAAARERGAEIAGEAAQAAAKVDGTLTDAALTAKIKSKMALDDYVQARDINVDTTNGAVALTGTVGSQAERQRAVRLARETRGVKSVSDRLQVRNP